MKPRQPGKLYQPVSSVVPQTCQELPPTASSSLPQPMREDLAKLGINIDDNVALAAAAAAAAATATANASPSQEEIADFIQTLQAKVQNSQKLIKDRQQVDYATIQQQMQPWLMNFSDPSSQTTTTNSSSSSSSRKGRTNLARRTPGLVDTFVNSAVTSAVASFDGSKTTSSSATTTGANNNNGSNSSISSLANIMNAGALAANLTNTVSGQHHKQDVQYPTTNSILGTPNVSNINIAATITTGSGSNGNGTNGGSSGGIIPTASASAAVGSGGLSGSSTNSGASHHAQLNSALNHFRVVTTSNLQSQQQQQLSQQKSVLSLHQHHQNDLSNRRSNHHLSTTNASFANLQAAVNASNAAAAAATTSATSTSDLNDLGKTLTNNIATKNLNPTSVVPNIMDTLGSMDNIFNDHSMQIGKDTATSFQSMIKHQQLQKLLKAKDSQMKSSMPLTTFPQRSDLQQPINSGKISATAQQLLAPASQANNVSSPQTAFSSVPKSLLNLAACSPSTLGNNSGRSNSTASAATTRSSQRQLPISLLSDDQTVAGGRNSTGLLCSTVGNSSGNSRATSSLCNVNSNLLNPRSSQLASVPGTSRKLATHNNSREGFLASLQEKVAKTSVNLEDTSRTTHQSSNGSAITNLTSSLFTSSAQNVDEPTATTFDRREIESALSRVEARNDLSLLYPPMILAPNSQKQINALSAGLQAADESELFTKEVKRIVLEECNIIYECKGCSNLFRSLANLVKHKRTYCNDQSNSRSSTDMNKRLCTGSGLADEQRGLSTETTTTLQSSPSDSVQNIDLNSSSTMLLDKSDQQTSLLSNYNLSTRPLDWRSNHLDEPRARRLMINRALNTPTKEIHLMNSSKTRANTGKSNFSLSKSQTSLCKLLQTQPKGRTSSNRDGALASALANLGSSMVANDSVATNTLRVFENEKEGHFSSSGINEQLVRNSSLAKTLLSEKAKIVSNPRQSLIELSKAEMASESTRSAPKRKFLEDCIRKVRRDKLLTDEEDSEQYTMKQTTSNSSAANYNAPNYNILDKSSTISQQSSSDLSKLNSPNESELDSDALMIDLDGSQKGESPTKKTKQDDGGENTLSASSDTSKFGSSSVLLKALTRPVDAKSKTQVVSAASTSTEKSDVDIFKTSTISSDEAIRNILTSNDGSCDSDKKLDQVHKSTDQTDEIKNHSSDSDEAASSSEGDEDDDTSSHDDSSMIDQNEETDAPVGEDDHITSHDIYDIVDQRQREDESAEPDEPNDARVEVVDSSSTSMSDTSTSDSSDSDSSDITTDGSSDSSSAQSEPHYEQQVSSVQAPGLDVAQQSEEKTPEPSISLDNQQERDDTPSGLFDKYTCELCDTQLQDIYSLIGHIVREHREETIVYPCLFCSLSFITMENVCKHIIDTHKKPKAQVEKLKGVVKNRSYLSSDFSGCSDYITPPCGAGSSGIMKLKIQLKTRPDDKNKVYEIV